MGGNAGEARLDVVAIGRDEITASVNKVNAELDAMRAKLRQFESAQTSSTAASKASTAAVTNFGDKLGNLKDSAKPVNQVRETFENLRSNAVFVVGAVTGIGAALVGLVKELLAAGTAMQELRDRAKEFAEAGKAVADAAEALRAALGQQADKTRQAYEAGVEKAQDLRQEIDLLDEAYGDQIKTILEVIAVQQKFALVIDPTQRLAYAKQLDTAEREAIRLTNERAKKAKEVADFEGLAAQYIREQNIEAAKAIAVRVLPGAALFLGDKTKAGTKAGTPTPTPTPPRGGGRKTDADDVAKRMYEAQRAQLDELATLEHQNTVGAWEEKRKLALAEQSEERARVEQRLGWIHEQRAAEEERLASIAAWEKDLAQERKDYDEAQTKDFESRITSFTGALETFGNAVDTKIPGAQKMFGDLARVWQGVDKSSKGLASGVVGSIDAILSSGAEWFKSEKEKTLFLAGKEAALAVAMAFINPAEAASHGVASAMLFALAGSGGGGGARSGGAASGGPRAEQSRDGGAGGGTTILQFNQLLTDKQTIQYAVDEAARGGRGTGYSRRAGV